MSNILSSVQQLHWILPYLNKAIPEGISDTPSLYVLLLKIKEPWKVYLVKCKTSGIICSTVNTLSLSCAMTLVSLVRIFADCEVAQEYIKVDRFCLITFSI